VKIKDEVKTVFNILTFNVICSNEFYEIEGKIFFGGRRLHLYGSRKEETITETIKIIW